MVSMTRSNLRSPRRKRGRHDIVIKILKVARDGERKTKIMEKAGLSFYQIERFLKGLKDAGFITEESGIWKTTRKGLHVIEACELCLRLLKEVP